MATRKIVEPVPPASGHCGIRISKRARANMVLANDECAFTTYAVLPGAGFALTAPVVTVAYWGPGDKIPPFVAGFGPLRMNLVGGVVFKNC
jgi:hypothetical protein